MARPHPNPFIIGTLATGAGFADRTAELARVEQALGSPGGRLVVFGERRLGKSSTLGMAAARLRKQGRAVAIIDLATATTAEDAVRRVLEAVRRAIGQDWQQWLPSLLRRLRATVTLAPQADPSGLSPIAVTLEPRLAGERATQVLGDALLAVQAEVSRRRKRLGIVLDEFQRLRELDAKGEGSWWPLKAALEGSPDVSYVLAGSERSLIEQLVADKKQALWKLADVLPMGPIPQREMAAWLHARAAATGQDWSPAVVEAVVRLAGDRTRDIVQLARAVWDASHGQKAPADASVSAALDTLVGEQAALHRRVWADCSRTAQLLLSVLTIEPDVRFLAEETLRRHRLGAKTTVQRTLRGLVERELLVVRPQRGGYAFDDPFFRRWIELEVVRT